MAFYQKRGKIPTKKHTQFRDSEGNLYWEELVSRGGFSDIYSNLYHIYPPTSIKSIGEFHKRKLTKTNFTHRHYHIHTSKLLSKGDYLNSIIPLFYNEDLDLCLLTFLLIYIWSLTEGS